MVVQSDDLVGINEIADLAGVSRQAVSNWRARAKDFPKPIVELKAGPVFRKSQIRSWLRRRRVPMSHVISTINLKGGVGKTTTTVALAETLSSEMGKHILIIDLDPQTNATTMLIGEERWYELNKKEKTLARLFKDALLSEPDDKTFDFDATLQKRVSDVSDTNIDLLPSSLDLIDVQDQLATIPSGRFYSINPIELLWRAVKSKLDDYDIVLVDCPPNLGIITLNGLRISHAYIIPTIPDHLSTYGIPQIVHRVGAFSAEIAEDIVPLGIAVTKYQAQSTVHKNVLRRLQRDGDAPVFNTVVRQANAIASAAEFSTTRRTLRQKYGYGGFVDDYLALAGEVMDCLE